MARKNPARGRASGRPGRLSEKILSVARTPAQALVLDKTRRKGIVERSEFGCFNFCFIINQLLIKQCMTTILFYSIHCRINQIIRGHFLGQKLYLQRLQSSEEFLNPAKEWKDVKVGKSVVCMNPYK